MQAAAARGALVALAAELAAVPAGGAFTIVDVAARTGQPVEHLQALRTICQLPEIPAQEVGLTPGDVVLAEMYSSAVELFGASGAEHLLRTIAASVSRIADAAISAFVTSAGPTSLADDGALIDVTERAAELRGSLPRIVDTLFSHHFVRLARPNVTGRRAEFEVRPAAVGFVDLVGYTSRAGRLRLQELGRSLAVFEARSADAVTKHGGRLVKFIGDGVMFTTADIATAARIALEIVSHPDSDATDVLGPVRGAVAAGDLLVREGDYFGPVVNLAARAAQVAVAGSVVAVGRIPEGEGRAGVAFEPLRDARLRGIGGPVRLFAVRTVPAAPAIARTAGNRTG
jgi:adenylate cyclase